MLSTPFLDACAPTITALRRTTVRRVWYGCVHGTSKPPQSARFDCNMLFRFDISNSSTRETREDPATSAPRTLEAHEDSVVPVLGGNLGLGTSK